MTADPGLDGPDVMLTSNQLLIGLSLTVVNWWILVGNARLGRKAAAIWLHTAGYSTDARTRRAIVSSADLFWNLEP